MYKVRKLSRQHLDYIWKHLRDYDREELVLQGYDREVVRQHLKHDVALCGLKNGKPFIAVGAEPWGNCVFVWTFGTAEIDRNWFYLHGLAKTFIRLLLRKYWGRSLIVEVWEQHTRSRRWLSRLGFRDTPHYRDVNGQRLRIMEYRGQLECAG